MCKSVEEYNTEKNVILGTRIHYLIKNTSILHENRKVTTNSSK
jgi:hypothetical protein